MPQKSTINFMMAVDGERRIAFHRPLPPRCDTIADERYTRHVFDKGKDKRRGADAGAARCATAATGEKLCTITSSYLFAR